MAATSSRFAVLKVDEEIEEVKPKKPAKKKQNKGGASNKPVPPQSNSKQDGPKKKSGNKKKPSIVTSSNSNQHRSVNVVSVINEDPSVWHDIDFVNGTFEQDLQQALLLSKLEEDKKLVASSRNKKSSKAHSEVYGINDYNCLNDKVNYDCLKPNDEMDRDFLDEELSRHDRSVHTYGNNSTDITHFRNVFEEDKVLSLQIEERLLNKDKEIVELKDDILRLSQELLTIKKRNKKLCNIFGNAEIKEKAEILVELEKVTQLKDELTVQVTELHSQLEQERSKVHHLTLELKKAMGNKKRTVSGSESSVAL